MQKLEQEALLATLQQSFNEAVRETGLKPRDVCHKLLAGSVIKLDAVDVDACQVEQMPGNFVRVTLPTPIPHAAALRTYKYRNPNNTAIVDDQGRWTGVVAYFREWQGFVGAAVQQVNVRRVHEANL